MAELLETSGCCRWYRRNKESVVALVLECRVRIESQPGVRLPSQVSHQLQCLDKATASTEQCMFRLPLPHTVVIHGNGARIC
jgi:hypothetical protein